MDIRSLRRRILPRTLFGRSLLIIIVPLMLLQGIVAFVFFDRHWNSMTGRLVDALAGETGMIVEELREAGQDAREIRRTIHSARRFELDVSIEKGRLSGEPEPLSTLMARLGIDELLHAALAHQIHEPFVLSGSPRRVNDRAFEIRVQLDPARVARIVALERRISSATTYIFLLWLFFSSLLLSGVAVMFMRNQVRPIRRLAVAAEKFGKGQDVPSFRIEGAAEVRQASRAFLEMKERLKRQIDQRTAMLAGVSHDLRTPLTRMKLQLAMAADGDGVADLLQDISEMEKMIEAYLTFAKGESDETPDAVDLATVVSRVAANARRQGAVVGEEVEGPLPLRARPVALERAVANVVSNAAKFAANVWISTRAEGGVYEITVDDDGPGIPPELREEVFRPFTRLEKSRNKRTGGIGLGLTIARDVIRAHGGEILLHDSPRGGLRAVIRIPG